MKVYDYYWFGGVEAKRWIARSEDLDFILGLTQTEGWDKSEDKLEWKKDGERQVVFVSKVNELGYTYTDDVDPYDKLKRTRAKIDAKLASMASLVAANEGKGITLSDSVKKELKSLKSDILALDENFFIGEDDE